MPDSTPWAVATVEQKTYGEVHGEQERDRRSRVFIQWKGTDVCFDFWCDCGGGGHYDGYFAYSIKCSQCGQAYIMPFDVYPLKIDESWQYHDPIVVTDDDDDRPYTRTDSTGQYKPEHRHLEIEDWARTVAHALAARVEADLIATVEQHFKKEKPDALA
jgi:hypothetical protein